MNPESRSNMCKNCTRVDTLGDTLRVNNILASYLTGMWPGEYAGEQIRNYARDKVREALDRIEATLPELAMGLEEIMEIAAARPIDPMAVAVSSMATVAISVREEADKIRTELGEPIPNTKR